MRTLYIVCVAVAVLLLGTTASFGAILTTGDSSSSASASASSSSPDDYEKDTGEYDIITTVSGTFDYGYAMVVYTEVSMSRGTPGDSGAAATAYASVSGAASDSAASALQIYSFGLYTDNDFAWEDDGTAELNPYEGLNFYHESQAVAAWDTTDTSLTCEAESSAEVDGSLE